MKYLVVVDMQNDFIDGSLGSPMAEGIVDKVCQKIEDYKNDGCGIIYTLDTHYEDYLSTSEGKKLPVEHCIKGTNGWKLNEKVKAAIGGNAVCFEKNTFGSVKLAQYLSDKAESCESIELCGLCTDICVVSNALLIKAYLPEKEIIVQADCCAGVTEESHNAALNTMRSCQITVI